MDANWFFELFAKYWLTAVFGIIATWLGKKVMHYRALQREEKERQEKEAFNNMINERFKETEESHKKLYKAVLDVQQKQFQRDCYEYINLEREISLEEFKNLYTDYNIYTSLGGNGIGSMLFEKVEEKYSNQLFSEKILEATMEKMRQLVAAETDKDTGQPQPLNPSSIPPNAVRLYIPKKERYPNEEAKG